MYGTALAWGRAQAYGTDLAAGQEGSKESDGLVVLVRILACDRDYGSAVAEIEIHVRGDDPAAFVQKIRT